MKIIGQIENTKVYWGLGDDSRVYFRFKTHAIDAWREAQFLNIFSMAVLVKEFKHLTDKKAFW
jgi:hypothetical protein